MNIAFRQVLIDHIIDNVGDGFELVGWHGGILSEIYPVVDILIYSLLPTPGRGWITIQTEAVWIRIVII